jgi:hypothetical protein
MLNQSDESLLYAFSMLLGQLGIQADIQALRDSVADQDVDFDTVTKNEHVHVVERGGYGTWPTDSNAIIHFQYQDREQPYIEVNGQRDANIVDHYCLVANYQDRTVVDSADGVIKQPLLYGEPFAWAIFAAGSGSQTPDPTYDTTRTYKVLSGGESGWQIAQKLRIDPNDLRDHNMDSFSDFSSIPAGTILHLPYVPEPVEQTPETTVKFLRQPLLMHVSNPDGTRKLAFADPRDVRPTGALIAAGKNLTIFAVAQLPTTDGSQSLFLEHKDVDSVHQKVKWTVGYREEDLQEGHVAGALKKVDPAMMQQIAADVEAENNPPSAASQPADEPEPPSDASPNLWKSTYTPLNAERKPEVFLFNIDCIVLDLEGKSRSRALRKYDGVSISGTFIGPDGEAYYRPTDALNSFTWYGIPINDPATGGPVISPESEVFDTRLSLAERSTTQYGRLTAVERFVTVPLAKATARSNWLKKYADVAKRNKE